MIDVCWSFCRLLVIKYTPIGELLGACVQHINHPAKFYTPVLNILIKSTLVINTLPLPPDDLRYRVTKETCHQSAVNTRGTNTLFLFSFWLE